MGLGLSLCHILIVLSFTFFQPLFQTASQRSDHLYKIFGKSGRNYVRKPIKLFRKRLKKNMHKNHPKTMT